MQTVPENCRLVVYGSADARSVELPVVRLSDPRMQTEIDSLVASGAETVLLADCRGGDALQRCDMALSVAEARAGRDPGSVGIVAAIDSAAGVMRIATLDRKSTRLKGLAWDRQAFSADMACPMDSAIIDHAWAQVLVAARAFHLPAYLFTNQAEPRDSR
jgi:citrate lyase subunit beta/citryl-CoA lyase